MDLRRKLARLKPPAAPPLPMREEPPTEGFETLTRHAALRHGTVPLTRALALTGSLAATLSLDDDLLRFDPHTAVYLDTETTGLSGGTGTLAFLVGIGLFDGRSFVVEQLFLSELDAEPDMLARLAERLANASAIVTFNGKSFDLPLLRTRFVMAGLAPLPDLPHLDLLHIARRIYGARVERCQLTAIEREVLNFARVGDIDGAEIPQRFQDYLRDRDRTMLLDVFEHNHHDIVALAALAGELGARASRLDSEGRLEPQDLTGLARTTLRAGRHTMAAHLARDAAALATDAVTARDALLVAAEVFRRDKDPRGALTSLREALTHAPEDPAVHLALSKLYEKPFADAEKALFHAERTQGAEADEAREKRLVRLKKRAAQAARQLRLPGFG